MDDFEQAYRDFMRWIYRTSTDVLKAHAGAPLLEWVSTLYDASVDESVLKALKQERLRQAEERPPHFADLITKEMHCFIQAAVFPMTRTVDASQDQDFFINTGKTILASLKAAFTNLPPWVQNTFEALKELLDILGHARYDMHTRP